MFHLLSLMHLPKCLKLAMVLSFPGFFTRLNIPIPSPVLQAAMLPHCYRLNQPVLMHTIHSLPLSSHSLFSSSLSSPPAIWIYFSVFPGLAPGLRGFFRSLILLGSFSSWRKEITPEMDSAMSPELNTSNLGFPISITP